MADAGAQIGSEIALRRSERAFGRSLSDFLIKSTATAHGLLPAEEQLLKCAAYGERCTISTVCPTSATPENTVRGLFLRFLLLGGDQQAPVHEKGVVLRGAFVEGNIDLESAQVRSWWLWACHVPERLHCRNATLEDIVLDECLVGHLDFTSASISGDVSLIGSQIDGEVSFARADIGGLLQCSNTNIRNPGAIALNCAGAKISGDALLQAGFKAKGEVTFLRAEVGGQLRCDGGSFVNPEGAALVCDGAKVLDCVFLRHQFTARGSVTFRNASIGSSLGCDGGNFLNPRLATGHRVAQLNREFVDFALDFTRAHIGNLWLAPGRGGDRVNIVGSVNLRGAYAGIFSDATTSWPEETTEVGGKNVPCYIALEGFTYSSLAGPTNYRFREKWLLRRLPTYQRADFLPQPFEQLSKVLREMGLDADARRIAMFKHSLLRPLRTKQARWYFRPFVWFTGWAWGLSCGYGYRPHRLFVALMAVWLACGFIYQTGAVHGGFAPRDAQVWTNSEYTAVCDPDWTACGKVSEIIKFNALLYSADMLLPAIDLGQRSTWVPMWREIKITLPYFGEATLPKLTLRATAWTENILGVLGVILIGAIFSGIVKRD